MAVLESRLSLGALFRVFPVQISVTWALTLLETFMLASLPLLIGRSIDGLLRNDWSAFSWLMIVMGALLMVAIGRRLYDTRAYGKMRVAFGEALARNGTGNSVSALNARLDMGRELVDFLEHEAPLVMTALIQVAVSLVILFSFHGALAASASGATIAVLLIYGVSSTRFFDLNRDLNQQMEGQVRVLESGAMRKIRDHLHALRRHEVRLSDMEALVYGHIFATLIAMLGFNLWFAAAKSSASPGQIFSIVTYSYEFIEAAVILPAALQSLTRISEITERINGGRRG